VKTSFTGQTRPEKAADLSLDQGRHGRARRVNCISKNSKAQILSGTTTLPTTPKPGKIVS
jgi:hypothetical protein